jgi:hypothetical protein
VFDYFSTNCLTTFPDGPELRHQRQAYLAAIPSEILYENC